MLGSLDSADGSVRADANASDLGDSDVESVNTQVTGMSMNTEFSMTPSAVADFNATVGKVLQTKIKEEIDKKTNSFEDVVETAAQGPAAGNCSAPSVPKPSRHAKAFPKPPTADRFPRDRQTWADLSDPADDETLGASVHVKAKPWDPYLTTL